MNNFTDEQKKVITTIDRNVSVSAGAGSGKTRVLVKRFVYILEQNMTENEKYAYQQQLRREDNTLLEDNAGAAIQQKLANFAQAEAAKYHPLVNAADIVAITFTRKAAGEMRQRAREEILEKIALAEKLQQGASVEDEEFSTKHSVSFWREQLRSLERMQISTIHSLCSRILKEHPVEVQLDPNFKVAEDFEGTEFLQNCLQKYLRQALKEDNTAVLQLVQVYGFNGLVRQIESLSENLADIAAEKDLTIPYRQSGRHLGELREQLCLAVTQLIQDKNNLTSAKSKGRQQLDELSSAQEEILQQLAEDPVNTTLLEAKMAGMRAAGKIKELVNEIRDNMGALKNLYIDLEAIPLVEQWQVVLQEFAAFCKQEKQENDFLTYNDLELLAVKLLSENPAVRSYYQQKYKYLMVDEFQDTNEKQRELIYLLCGDDKDVLSGKKLFIVGDPKQSIYRFRGADVSVFARVRRDIAATGGSLLTLSKNFRSEKNILDFCNQAFEPLLGSDTTQDVYFEALSEHKHASDVKPEFLQVPFDEELGYTVHEREGQIIAQKITQLHQNKIAYGKIAILLRAMTHTDEITDALQQYNIPYKVIDGKGFYELQEIIDLLNLFNVLHNRYRDFELAGVLRSPYFAIDDVTLTKLFLCKKACLWDAVQEADYAALGEQGMLLQRAADVLRALRMTASLMALPELFQQVWDKLAVPLSLSLQEHGRNKLANAEKLRVLAQQYSVNNTHQGTLGGWLDYVQRLRLAEARETAANLPSEDVVQILTIHKSKGLQFPIVILPYLSDKNNQDTNECRYLPQIGFGIKALDENGVLTSTAVLQQVKDVNKDLDLQERSRMLYVAMTRAEEHLILSGVLPSSSKEEEKTVREMSWFAALKSIFSKYFGQNTDEAPLTTQNEFQDSVVKNVANNDLTGEVHEATLLMQPLPAYAANGQCYFTASALQTYLYCQRRYYYQQIMQLPELDAVTIGGEQLPAYVTGLIVHKALELYRGGNAEAAFATAVKEFAPGNLALQAQELFKTYIHSDLYKQLPQKRERELHFKLATENGLFLQGVIDCLGYEEDGSLTIVDYKTGVAPMDNEVKLGYAYQLALYKKAAEQMLEQTVNSAKLHFLQNLSVWELPASEHDYLAEALALCEEISSKGDENDFSCSTNGCTYCLYQYLCKKH